LSRGGGRQRCRKQEHCAAKQIVKISRCDGLAVWPLPGGSDHLLSLQSELLVPTAFSLLS